MNSASPYNILVVDDNEAIHRDFSKILSGRPSGGDLAAAGAALFGVTPAGAAPGRAAYRLDFASQGEQALDLLRRAKAEGRAFALAFVDMRMPPGWDGLRTIQELWRESDDLHVVICTAFSDHSLADISSLLGQPDRLLVLKKPFDSVEVEQLAVSLTEKWRLGHDERKRVAELTRAWAQAEQAVRAKSQFLANMSHEIRTPMTAILGYADILREDDLPRETQVAYLETIRRCGDHLLGVLSDILDVSKLEVDRVDLESLSLSPVQLVRGAVSIVHGAAVEKGLQLELSCEGSFPETVTGDPTRIRQILLNLLGNAIKFTHAGHVHARVRACPGLRPNLAELQIEVEDTGVGIPAQELTQLFSIFTQGDASMTRRFGGTGLGLVISRRLARAMGGDIQVSSEEGRGSCFTATLVLAVPEGTSWGPVDPRQGEEAREPAKADPPDLKLAARILLAEDARDNQFLISLQLRRAGARVSIANDGQEALEMWTAAEATDAPYDMLVTDMQMPRLDGYELTRRLRASGCRAPILALTAHALSQDRDPCIQAGCDEYLSKPVDRVRLVQACARLLAKPALPTSSSDREATQSA